VGSDGALLDQEIDKLICFVGERPTIERADVFRLTPSSRTETFWKIAEEIVWERVFHSASDAFYALIPALRSQLQLGKKIGSLHAAGIAKEKWPDYLAKIWPKTLEKRSAQALQLGAAYFQRGLQALFEIERLSRTGSTREEALFDLFQINLISYVPR
jgi:DNA polymerase-3 subunit delta